MASDIWLRTILIVRKETCCHHIGYSYRLTARVLLCAPSHRQDNTYHSLCYTSRGALAGARNSSMGPPWRIDPTTHRTMSECSYHRATSRSSTWTAWSTVNHPSAPYCRQNSSYCSLCYSRCGTLAGKRNIYIDPPGGMDLTTHRTMSGCSTTELSPVQRTSK